MEKEIKKLSYSIKEYYMDSFKYQLSENKYNEFQKIFIKLSNLSYGVYPNDDGSDFEIMSVALKLKNDYSIHFSCHKINEMSLYIQHDKKISYLIQNRKTFNGTYKMKQTMFEICFGLKHLSLRDILLFTNYLGDEEYSFKIDTICSTLRELFNDKKKIDRNRLHWAGVAPKTCEWLTIHSADNLSKIGKLICKRKASLLFDKKKQKELFNMNFNFIVNFTVNENNIVHDVYIDVIASGGDEQWYMYYYDEIDRYKKNSINEKKENKGFIERVPDTCALTGMDMLNLVCKDIVIYD